MKIRAVSLAALLLAVALLQQASYAEGYGPKAKGPKAVWVAVFSNAKSTDPKYDRSRGFTPAETKVHVGDHIVFFNIDDEVHTATLRLAGAFPPNATKAMGHKISDLWSTGDLRVNGESSPILADKAGKYAYGCVHHFDQGQRATIVVGP